MNSKTLVVGSLAFDIIFSIPGDFRKSIPLVNGEIRNFNATYVANEKKEFPGGTAGNIAFWLGQVSSGRDGDGGKISSTIFSAWGKDISLKGYRQKLEKLGARLAGPEGEHTAHAYIVSDQLHQQLIIWQPNAYEKNETSSLTDFLSQEEISGFKYAIFSAGTPSSIEKHLKEFRAINSSAVVILDPGQISQFFTKEGFEKCCELSDILVGNNIEFQYYAGYGIPENIITIETLGALGADIKIPVADGASETIHVDALKVENVVETTGAGDAFRAGVLASLAEDEALTEEGANLAEEGALTEDSLTADSLPAGSLKVASLTPASLKKAVEKGVLLGAECVKIPSAQF